MHDTAAMAKTVTITPISQRPRLLSVSSVDSRPSAPISNHEAYTPRSDSLSDTIPSPKGIKLPHTRYIPIRVQSPTAAPPTSATRPPLTRALHSAPAASSSSLSAPISMQGLRRSDEEVWSRPLGNYSFCNSYEATTYSPPDPSSSSRPTERSKSHPRTGSQPGHRKRKSSARRSGEGEHIGAWLKKLWTR